MSNVSKKFLWAFMFFALLFSSVPAPAFAAIYAPGATLDPTCLPTDVTCGVTPPLSSSTTTPATASTFSGTSTTTPSTFAYATSTNFQAQNATTTNLSATSGVIASLTSTLANIVSAMVDTLTARIATLYTATVGTFTATSTAQFLAGASAPTFNATSTTATSTFAGKVDVGSLKVGAGSGILFATNGFVSAVATSSLGIALSDTTGTLAINRGGTGTSTAPMYGKLLLGNAGGTYDLVATSTLGLLATALTSLNGLTASTQTFAIGTSGTDFGITSSGSTHTFNLPDASATARGLVSTNTQIFAGNKTLSGNTNIGGTFNVTGASTLVTTTITGTLTQTSSSATTNALDLTASSLTSGHGLSITAAPSGVGAPLQITRTSGGTGRYIQYSDGTYVAGVYGGYGSPEGVFAAGVGSYAYDTLNGELYTKKSGSGNTGWKLLFHGGSFSGGATVADNGLVTLALATPTNDGAVSSTTQTFAGNKTFTGTTALGTTTVASANGLTLNAFSTNAGSTTALRFSELAANGTNYVAFRAPDNVGSNVVWTLPNSDGTPNQMLKTDGAGTLQWGSGAAPLSSLTAATTINTIDSLNFAQIWNWSTLSNQTALTLADNSMTSGGLLAVTSASNGATGDLGKFELGGNNASVAGNALKVGITGASSAGTALNITNAGTGFSLRVNKGGAYNDPTPFVITAAGNVGVGTSTPTSQLDIVATDIPTFTGVSAGVMKLIGSGASSGNYTALDFSDNISTVSPNPFARIAMKTTTAGSELHFGTSNFFGIGITKDAMMIGPTGNVGIGTTSPSSALSVAGDILGFGALTLTGTATSSLSGGLSVANLSLGAGSGLLFSAANGYVTKVATSTLGSSQWTSSGSNIYYNTGNVGIGTSTPSSKLAVSGGLSVFGQVASTTNIYASAIVTGSPTITTAGGYTIYTFTGSGTFTPNGAVNVEYLVVGGGGGGGSARHGGGGGAGGFRTGTGFAVTAQSYSISVGAGGAGGNGSAGSDGGASVFSTITSTGGGGGGSWSTAINGRTGGSGGGGSLTGIGGTGISGQGSGGGSGVSAGPNYGGGGGGGASAIGADGTVTTGGNGGAGTASSISGASVTYAGGGGGATYQGGTPGAGGAGGGGAGSTQNNATSATANTGGGGGGSGGLPDTGIGGNGGSGIVIVRYLTNTIVATSSINIDTNALAVGTDGKTTISGGLTANTLTLGNLSGLLLANAGVVSNFATSTATTGQVLSVDGSGALAWANVSGGSSATTTINGASGPTFTFTTGTSGTDFAIATSSGALSFNLPNAATSTVRGLITNAAQTIGGAKTFANALFVSDTATSTFSGGLTIANLSLGTGSGLLSAANGFVNKVATSTLGIALSDTAGILTANRGGTGLAATTTPNMLLLSNAGGGYDLVATSSLGISGGGSFQWTTSGADIYYTTGKVGIGTTTPGSVLSIAGAVNTTVVVPVSATGGTITQSGGYTIHTFTSSGTFTPNGAVNVEYLVVGGGGGGGGSIGGGGGAGGFRTGAGFAVTAQSYSISVGAGGAGGTGRVSGTSGSDSIFSTLTATGGGGGGTDPTSGVDSGKNGGSGGGGSGGSSFSGGTGVAGQGNNGGSANGWPGGGAYSAGGGGGAGTAGASATVNAGAGGTATSSSITGTATLYAAGGGGGSYIGTGASGGSGIGGSGGGASNGGVATSGAVNTGSGGGGVGNDSATNSGGGGGSGIVIVRYLTSATTTVVIPQAQQALLKVTDTGTAASSTLAFFSGTSGQGCIIAGATGLSCSSDISLKHNINAIENSLGSVLALKPVTYDWNYEAPGTGNHIGFIAQDVEKIFPGLVVIDPNGKKMLAYDRFAPILAAALQEQYGGLMGVNIASVPDTSALFSSTTTLDALATSTASTDFIADPIAYIRERVQGGINIVRTLVTERIVAVSGYFKHIFANELCLTDSDGKQVCITGDQLKNIGGSAAAVSAPASAVSEPAVTSTTTPITDTASSTPNATSTPENSVATTTPAIETPVAPVVETPAPVEQAPAVDLIGSPQVEAPATAPSTPPAPADVPAQ